MATIKEIDLATAKELAGLFEQLSKFYKAEAEKIRLSENSKKKSLKKGNAS